MVTATADINDLRREKHSLKTRAQAILDHAEDSGELTPEDAANFDNLLDRLEGLNGQIEKAEQLRFSRLRAAQTQINPQSNFSPVGASIDDLYPERKKMISASPDSRLATSLKTFSGPTGLADAQVSGEFLRNVINGDIKMTMTENDPGAGGYTVPVELTRRIIDKRERVGISRQTASVTPMQSDILQVPKLISGPAVAYVGEASAITPVDQVWGQIELHAKKRAVLVKISNELLQDSVINLAEYVAGRAAFELAKQEDQEYVNGDAASTYGGEVGLLTSLGTAGVFTPTDDHDAWDAFTMADLTACMGLLPSDYGDNTRWICSPQFYYSVMVRLLASAGGNDIVTLEAGGGPRPTFLGRPVFLTSAMPTATATSTVSALFGCFSEAAVIGDRVSLEVAVSTDRYFDEYCTALRVIARYDLNIHEGGDDTNPGAYVGLSTHS